MARSLVAQLEMRLHAAAEEPSVLGALVVEAKIAAAETAGLVVDLRAMPVAVEARPIHRLRTSLISVVRMLTKVTQ